MKMWSSIVNGPTNKKQENMQSECDSHSKKDNKVYVVLLPRKVMKKKFGNRCNLSKVNVMVIQKRLKYILHC